MSVIVSVLMFALMFGALADIITINESKVKHLPKLVWIIIVILLPIIGSILWFLVGREYAPRSEGPRAQVPRRAERTIRSPRDTGIVLGPKNTEAEIAALNREIAAHERVERIRELEAQLESKRREKGSKG